MRKLFASLTWSQRIGAVFGATYVLIGLVGFVVTAGVGFTATQGKDLIFFELNPLHNLVHLGIGGALLLAARASAKSSSLMNRVIGGTYLLVAVVGAILVQADSTLFSGLIEQRHSLNILALNHPDNLLHLASAIVLIGSTLVARRSTDRSSAPAEAPEATVRAEATNEMAAAVPAVMEEPALASSARAARLSGGDVAPRAGSYRCACRRFAVAIQQGRELPECPEPDGTDDDHYFQLQRKPAGPVRKTSRGSSKNGRAPAPTVAKARSRS